MFGSVGAWLYKALAGIEQAESSAGFEKLLLRPQMVRDLRYASGSVKTVRGDVTCAWSRTDRSIRLDAAVPLGAEAEIAIPKFNLKNISVKEGGRTIWADGAFVPGIEGVLEAKDASGSIVIKTGSGRYAFELTGK
jgi:alpha-L-rhamnosidase